VADESQAGHWKTVFEDHPEFFRLDTEREKASLVWRRQYPRRYHVDQERHLSLEEFKSLSAEEKDRVSRYPLTAEDIKALIDAAIKLHATAVASKQEKRWWVTLASSAIGGLVGALIGAFYGRA
jgi:hypothetical protein